MGKKDSSAMQRICRTALVSISFAGGDVIFNAGEVAHRMFFVVGGMAFYTKSSSIGRVGKCPSIGSRLSHRSSDTVLPLRVQRWVAEPALWTDWMHMGNLDSMTASQV